MKKIPQEIDVTANGAGTDFQRFSDTPGGAASVGLQSLVDVTDADESRGTDSRDGHGGKGKRRVGEGDNEENKGLKDKVNEERKSDK